MEKQNLNALLETNTYPGRGITIGLTEDGAHAVIAYFIMGRSANSRNRVFTPKDGGIITEAADPAKLEDPSLIIYAPVRVDDNVTVVTNGNQTDTVMEHLAQGATFYDALHTREFEPDAPNYTPRISGIVDVGGGLFTYEMAILKSAEGDPGECLRYFFEYAAPRPGEGRFLSTYQCDGNPIPSFEGEPVRVAVEGGLDEFANGLWSSLNEDNKVSLFVRFIDVKTGATEDRLFNKYSKV